MFLLVRRPEKGLLAGLYEFPATSNVSESLGHDAFIELASEQIGSLLEPSVLPLGHPGGSQAENQLGDYCIAHVRFAGDVQHVFSHIKKRYRVQWVRIGGGREPPPLKLSLSKVVSNQTAKKSTPASPQAMWIPIEDVAEVNIGTGVGKVWRLVKGLWERQRVPVSEDVILDQ
ncbi:hypothetical protein VNI00_011561 [Paramarasmius palmivorus]|uniref:Adenine DNA glycosylase C-terminal domain-containing protein n=1 Tax=Paramarasmius palmivorus TaxID=297713 RepID=A0AAW0CEC3_9AGAR